MAERKYWQMGHRELVDYFADLVESFESDVPGAKGIAEHIRLHKRKPRTTAQRVYTVHLEHPEWTAQEIAQSLGCLVQFVNQCATRHGWKPRRMRADDPSVTTHRSTSRVTPQQVRNKHEQFPEWTAKQIAQDLGCSTNYVNMRARQEGWAPRRLSAEELSRINTANSRKTRAPRVR